MEQKLTAQIAHVYSGAKVLNKESGYCFEMVAISDSYILVYQPPSSGDESGDGGDELEWKPSDCQPILTRLSNITDEDALEVAKILYTPVSIYISANAGREIVTNMDTYTFRFNKANRIIDFLRSKSYDCGYGSIPYLIEAGIAIEDNAKK